MKTYQVYIESRQSWTYVYEIEAENESEAERMGLEKHEKGVQADDNYLDSEEFECFQTIEGSI